MIETGSVLSQTLFITTTFGLLMALVAILPEPMAENVIICMDITMADPIFGADVHPKKGFLPKIEHIPKISIC